MSSSPSPSDAIASLRRAMRYATEGLVERDTLVELVVLAAVAREHLLVLGPPGTGKSHAVRRVAEALGGAYFEYLLGRFTEPSELFGPVDLTKLRAGTVETRTEGMLPEAQIAFLDEVFLGSSAILNTLLGLLNERVFRRGHSLVRCPLRVCVGASNALPDEPELAAFADRFLLRVHVEPVADAFLEDLLSEGARTNLEGEARAVARIEDVDVLAALAQQVDLQPVRGDIAHAIRVLRKAGVTLTDRRAVKAQKLVAAAAVLAGRATATRADLWPLVTVVPTAEGQTAAREHLRALLAESESATLAGAALEVSSGPLARAAKLVAEGTAMLEGLPSSPSDTDREGVRLRLEGLARSLDASFSEATAPDAVRELRGRVVAALGALS